MTIYCRYRNIREILIFANFAWRTNSRIQESRENDNYNKALLKKNEIRDFLTSWKLTKSEIRENLNTRKLSDLQYTIDDLPFTAKLFKLFFFPLEVVSRWRDSQLQVGENYSYLTKCRWTILKPCWMMSRFM